MRAWRLSPAALAGAVALLVGLSGCGQSAGPSVPIAAPAVDDGMLAQDEESTSGPIRAYFNDSYRSTIEENEPRARANPHNPDKALFKLVNGARRSLDASFYDLEEPTVAEALVQAKRRGVKVRVVTDSDNLEDESGKLRDSFKILKSGGVPVREDRRSAIMHDKYLIADHRYVWTGSTNATVRSLYWHNNNSVVVVSEALAGIYTRVFERQFVGGHFGPASLLADIADGGGLVIGGAHVQPFFSPKGGGKAAVVATLREARRTIRFMTFSLTDVEVGETLVAKHRAGVNVSGVFDRWLAAGDHSLFQPLKRRGLDVRTDGNQALMHHKVVILDGTVVITGSFNYSQNAEMANNENFLIIRGATAIARAYVNEFGRVERAAKVNRPPPMKPRDPEVGAGEQ